jgi:two-component system nitrogen regulation response regulator NtrX
MRVLIIDDEGNIRRMLRALLASEGWSVQDVETAEEGLVEVETAAPDVVLLDLMLPGMDGLEALRRLTATTPWLPVVMMSGHATLPDAVRATREGAFHFLEKPLTPEAVLVTLRGALEVSRARDLTRALTEGLGPDARLVGETGEMRAVRERIRKVAPTDARVLVTGESGTGKELAAAAIHGLSTRRGGPFVCVNSAAIPRELVESEMFGHEKGAFTGATHRRRGRFELAHGGTLFLDEIADLDGGAQAKLLRVLEEGVVERVGGQAPVPVDVRVVAASNRDLEAEARAGRFRDDLLYRLDVVPLHMPPLRERLDDVPLLVEHALHRLRRRQGMRPPAFPPEALERLARYPWPGNVRELMNVVERLAILVSGPEVRAEDVSALLPERGPRRSGRNGGSLETDARRSLRERLDDYERRLLTEALADAGGNVAEAGRRLRTDRANLYRRMKRLGVQP